MMIEIIILIALYFICGFIVSLIILFRERKVNDIEIDDDIMYLICFITLLGYFTIPIALWGSIGKFLDNHKKSIITFLWKIANVGIKNKDDANDK